MSEHEAEYSIEALVKAGFVVLRPVRAGDLPDNSVFLLPHYDQHVVTNHGVWQDPHRPGIYDDYDGWFEDDAIVHVEVTE